MGLSAGTKVDRYEVSDLLGAGGMGEVYRARDPKLERQIALKILRAQEGASAGGMASLLREARAVAALSHPNVLAVYDVGEVQEPEELRGLSYIAMELIVGRSLRACVGDETVPMALRIDWLRDVARALEAAHDVGIVHRDVKPENVMIRFDGLVKVLDFGIARRVSIAIDPTSSTDGVHSLPTLRAAATTGPASGKPLTTSGGLVGTPFYMSPEQLRGEVLDGRTDQFSWGVVAYELLTGSPPWRSGNDAVAVVADILGGVPRTPREVEPSIPLAVAAVIERALAKSPERRFPSMRGLLANLDDAAGATRLPPRAPVAPVASDGRPLPRLVWLALAALAAGGIALASSSRPHAASAPTASRASPAARPTTLLDLPPPASDHPDALAAYAEGMRALHDGSWGIAHDGFVRAAAADPSLAIAHLRIAMTSLAFGGGFSAVRIEYQKAAQLQARLGERDATLFEALEPTLQRTPPDTDEASIRLQRALVRYPNDAELNYILGFTSFYEPAISLPPLARATALDPRFADAWEAQGRVLGWAGKPDEARASFGHCLEIPTAIDCVYWLFLMDSALGDCSACEAEARQRIDRDPRGQWGYRYLADSLAALGRSDEGPRAALEQAWGKWDDRSMTENDRAWERLTDEAQLAVLKGDFARATEFSERALALAELDTEGGRHARPTRLLVQIALETGDAARAAELADAFVKRAAVWTMTEKGTFSKDAGDLPWLQHIAYRGGRFRRADLATARDEWVKRWRRGSQPGWSWVIAYAKSADEPEDAKEALDKLGELGPLPPLFPAQTNPELDIGRVYALAGQAVEAEAHLARAARSCVRLDDPFAHPHAELEHGRVLETLGDRKHACESYGAVLAQWGGALPRSVTVEAARERMRALGCPK